jgi:hypothetical protein
MAVVKEAIQHGGHRRGVAQQLAPVVDWTIAGHQGTDPLVAAHYYFQKIFGRGQGQLPPAQVIDDQRLPRRLGPHEDSFATDHTDSSKRYHDPRLNLAAAYPRSCHA